MTDPAGTKWDDAAIPGFRRSEITAFIGRGDAVWERATLDVLRWRVKTRSGFLVDADQPVRVGDRLDVRVRVLGLTVVEPVEVVAVVEEAGRVGFAYRTRPGHPVRGEEAFIVHRHGDEVRLTLRSLTAPSDRAGWRVIHPLLLVAQAIVRRRYLRALR